MLSRLTKIFFTCAGLIAGVLSAHTQAGIIALTGTTSVGNQSYIGTVGMDFNVNAGFEISISAFGAFDAGADGFGADCSTAFNSSCPIIGLFNRTTSSLLVVTRALGTATLNNGYRMSSTGDYGTYGEGAYTLASVFPDSSDLIHNAGISGIAPNINDGGGAISFVGTGRFDRLNPGSPGQLVFPTAIDGGPANRYHAATFEYTVSRTPNAVPAPATLALIGVGLAGLGWSRRKAA